jgi:hypothetical protein
VPTAPWKTPVVGEIPQYSKLQVADLLQKVKASTAAANEPPPAPKAPWAKPAIADITPPAPEPSSDVPAGVMRDSKKLMTGIAKAASLKAKAEAADAKVKATADKAAAKAAVAEAKLKATQLKAALKAQKPAAASLSSAVAPKTMADVLASVEEAAAPKKIKKTNGKMAEEPKATASDDFEPLPNDKLYPHGITPSEYAQLELAANRKPGYPQKAIDNYVASARMSEEARQAVRDKLLGDYPEHAAPIKALHRQLQKAGRNPERIAKTVNAYKHHVPAHVAAAMDAYKQ